MLAILFWVLFILCALGGGYYWRAQAFAPGFGVVLVLIGLIGWKVYPLAM